MAVARCSPQAGLVSNASVSLQLKTHGRTISLVMIVEKQEKGNHTAIDDIGHALAKTPPWMPFPARHCRHSPWLLKACDEVFQILETFELLSQPWPQHRLMLNSPTSLCNEKLELSFNSYLPSALEALPILSFHTCGCTPK